MDDAVNLVAATDHEADLKGLVTAILDRARTNGADSAEVSASEDAGLSVTVRLGELETVEFNRDRGFGITVYFGKRKGSASTSDSSRDGIDKTVAAACNIARFTEEDAHHGLADAALMARVFPNLDLDHPWTTSVADAQTMAQAAEAAARGHDKRITNSDGASVSTQRVCRVYGNSNGFLGSHIGTRHSVSCGVIAGDGNGMQRDYYYTVGRAIDDLKEPGAVGAEAARRAVARLGARPIKTGRYPVLFATEIAGGLIGHLLSALSGGSLYRKASFLTDSLGRALLPDAYSVIERPLLPRGPGSAAFDGDGVATFEKAFVDRGRIASYVLGAYSARRLGMATTANAGGVHNVWLDGPRTPIADLVRGIREGLLVTELIGQGVNIVTGDYSRGAAGYWISNGEVVHPVDEITIAGHLAQMLGAIAAVGDDPDLRGNVVTGSMLIDGMTVAG
jgi:PmbA protein